MTKRVPLQEVKNQVSSAEWQARIKLAACYRLLSVFGMTDLIYNHITAKSEDGHSFLINPYGYLYQEITASSLIKVSLEGEILFQPDIDYGINYPGYVIHSAIHEARGDVGCIVHTHTRAGTAVAAMRQGLMPISQHAMRFFGCTSYHDYEGPAFNTEEKSRLQADLGSNDVLLLRNHGLLACGRTVEEAFNVMYYLEMASRIQVDALSAGVAEVLIASEAAARSVNEVMGKHGNPEHHGAFDGSREWPAMLRLLDRVNPGYAE